MASNVGLQVGLAYWAHWAQVEREAERERDAQARRATRRDWLKLNLGLHGATNDEVSPNANRLQQDQQVSTEAGRLAKDMKRRTLCTVAPIWPNPLPLLQQAAALAPLLVAHFPVSSMQLPQPTSHSL